MKYLLLLLTTFNVYAADCISGKPCKVSVTKNSEIKYQATFDTQELAEAWVADNEKRLKGKKYRNSFGLMDRWYLRDTGSSVDSREIVIPPSLDSEGNVIIEGSSYFEFKYLQNYVVSYEDITVQMDQERADKLEDDTERKALRDINLDRIKKKPNETVAKYRDRRDQLIIRLFKRIIRDRYGKKQ